MCSERDSPLKRLYRRTHAKLTRLAGSGQLDWAAVCELSLALVHARRPAWPGETSETILWVAPPRKTRPPDHTRVNWPVDASASGSAQVGPGGRHRWAARVQVGQEPARQKAREGYPSHYTSLVPYLVPRTADCLSPLWLNTEHWPYAPGVCSVTGMSCWILHSWIIEYSLRWNSQDLHSGIPVRNGFLLSDMMQFVNFNRPPDLDNIMGLE